MNNMHAQFVFDDECQFCTRFIMWVKRHRVKDVDFVPASIYHGPGSDILNRSSVLIFACSKAIYSRSEGIGRLLKMSDSVLLRLLGSIILAPGVGWICGHVYDQISSWRKRMPFGCSASGTCSLQ